MASSSDDCVSSDTDSELEAIALKASNKIKRLLEKSRNTKQKKETTKLKRDNVSPSDDDVETKSDSLKTSEKTKTIMKTTRSTSTQKPQTSSNLDENKSVGKSDNSDVGLQFVIDKSPKKNEEGNEMLSPFSQEQCEKNQVNENFMKESVKKLGNLSSSLQTGIQLSDNYLNEKVGMKKSKAYSSRYDELMKKSVITSDFEKQSTVMPYEESIRQQKKQRKKERDKTKGKNWYNIEAPEMTDERKNDLMVLQMRKALDPKRFYKNNDIKALPKYFQFGTVVESPADFYHSRIPQKQRKSNMVDELLADAEFRKYNKRKYSEIQEQKRKAIGPYKHMKRLKKNKR